MTRDHPGLPTNSTGPAMSGSPPGSDSTVAVDGTSDPRFASSPSEDRIPSSIQPRDPRRYQLLAEHGRGGLGRVYRARDKELGRDVALKELLHPSHHSERRFLREALITARLEHPGIVPVHEAGRWPDGTPFYAMKLVAGRPFSELLAETRTLDRRLALLPHLIAVADAIAYAHDRRIIHRDLKPSNVIIGEFGETVVIDWGLAKELTETIEPDLSDGPYRISADPAFTEAGSVLGTPAYMSPEQARGDFADTRSDVYSLGAMLYQLCAGTAPQPHAPADKLRANLRGVPADLAAIVLKSLSPTPDDRYTVASLFASDLRAYDAGARITARRYSLAALFWHWIRHHKRVAISIAVPTAVATVIGALSLREIVLQRYRASHAQHEAEAERRAAETERDLAIRSHSVMLLEKDPTKARTLLASRPVLTPDDALLIARAQGAGTADHIISLLPFKIWDAVPDEELETLAISASDHKLRIIDLATGRVDVVDDQLLEPSPLIREGRGFAYARHGRDGPELVRTRNSMTPVSLLGFRQSIDKQAVASADGLYFLGGNGELVLLSQTGVFQSVGQGFGRIVPYRGGLLACTRTDLVQVVRGLVSRKGRCRLGGPRHALATAGDGYIVQDTPSRVFLVRRGVRSTMPISGTNQFVMTASGLVAGIDAMRRTWYVRPGSVQKVNGPGSDAMPWALGADGNLAAWGDVEGVVHVRDTSTGATWTFVGHSGPVGWIFLSARLGRIVTVGWPEVRVWHIPPFSLRPVVPVACDAITLASSHDGKRVAATCGDGTVSLIERDDSAARVRTVHRHKNLAFGVTWRGDELCSSGRDGKVICTDTATGLTKVVAEHPRSIRFVHGAADVLAYTVEDGGVWAHVTGDEAPRLLYRHKAEPYCVAVSVAGDVASGANDGSVMVFERSTGQVHGASKPHTDGVLQIHWRGDELQTSSYDGTVRTWRKDLTLESVASANRPIRHLEPLGSGWVASVGGTRLWLHSDGTDLQLETGPVVSDLSVSTDSRFAGAVVSGDLIVYDVRDKGLAALRLGDASAGLHFVDATTLFAYGSSGEISSISVETLPFVKLTKDRNNP